jgi:hypothetical protein
VAWPSTRPEPPLSILSLPKRRWVTRRPYRAREDMKYICLGYLDERTWDTLSEGERNPPMDERFAYDDMLRRGGHSVGGRRSKAPGTPPR